MSYYDNLLINEAEEYWKDCIPTVIKTDYEVDYDEDFQMIQVPYSIINCEECDNKECEYWEKYNEQYN